jgi:signal transduction histidine kinase
MLCPQKIGQITIRVRTTGKSVHVMVSDNGGGIPDEFASRLFEPSLTSKLSGSGLGLWLSHRIITKHQGKLRFRTSRKQGRAGTSFGISLPLSQTA